MKNLCFVSDFDGTITVQDSLYHFFELFAPPKWMEIEQDWVNGKIDSKQCLINEFELLPNITENFILNYLKKVEIDPFFLDFYEFSKNNNIDFFVVSDGLDFFINNILENYNIKNLNIISNNARFVEDKFTISFPNDYSKCEKNSGTCKCKIISDLKSEYKKVVYFGDGASDFCVANKVDMLFAKKKLEKFCKDNNINYFPYNNFSDIKQKISKSNIPF